MKYSEDPRIHCNPKPHNLKCHIPYFDDIVEGKKIFDLRFNDRDFKINDIVLRKINR